MVQISTIEIHDNGALLCIVIIMRTVIYTWVTVVSIVLAACAPPKKPVAPSASAVPPPATAPKAPFTSIPGTTPTPDTNTVVIGKRYAIQSKIMGEERSYQVHLPENYQASQTNYPVIYLLDGPWHFHHASGIVQFLSTRGRMPQAIIVAIANTKRTRDLTPTNETRAPESGGADRFLDFIEKELMPSIESTYRVAPYKILIGHSFGGLFAVHALLTRPGLFHAHIAASPSLQWDNQLMAKMATPMLAAGTLKDNFLYFTVGGEPQPITDGNKNFATLLKKSAPASFRWGFAHMEAEDHSSIVHRTIYDGLEKLFADWQRLRTANSLSELKKTHQRISKHFALEIPENLINALGYRQLLAKPRNLPGAIEFFKFNVERYPQSANVYDSLGEALEASGDLQGALSNYQRAIHHADKAAAVRDTFISNRDRVAKALGQ